MKKTQRLAVLIAFATFFVACEKEPQTTETTSEVIPVQQTPLTHALILNEGDPLLNNATLSYIDLATGSLTNDWFLANNNRPLGSLGGDIIVYGSKIYVTVSQSGTLEVIDSLTGVSHQYSLGNSYPNRMTANNGKLYITCHYPRSVISIDTTAPGNVEASCLLGDYNPEGIAILNGKLFVASTWVSDSYNNVSYDNTIYVVDINSFTVDTTLTVATNPQKVIPVDNNRVIVNCWGAWDMNNGSTTGVGTAIIDATTLSVTTSPQLLTRMAVHNGLVYGYSSTYDADWHQTINYFTFNPTTLETTPLPIHLDDDDTYNPYSIAIHPDNGDIYLSTDGGTNGAKGDLYCFSSNGTRRWRNEVGKFPSKIIFY